MKFLSFCLSVSPYQPLWSKPVMKDSYHHHLHSSLLRKWSVSSVWIAFTWPQTAKQRNLSLFKSLWRRVCITISFSFADLSEPNVNCKQRSYQWAWTPSYTVSKRYECIGLVYGVCVCVCVSVCVCDETLKTVVNIEVGCCFDLYMDTCHYSKLLKYQPLVSRICQLGYQCKPLSLIFGSLGHIHNKMLLCFSHHR